MSEIRVNVKKLQSNAVIPIFAHSNDACADLVANEDVIIQPAGISMVGTGIALAVPIGYEAQVRPRSGLAAKKGIGILNSPGTIDAGYRGEVKVIMINTSDIAYQIRKGDRIAQMAIREVPPVKFVEVEELDDTERGEGGFGSTGI